MYSPCDNTSGRCVARKARPSLNPTGRRQHPKLPRPEGRKKWTFPPPATVYNHGFGGDQGVAHCASQQGAALDTCGDRPMLCTEYLSYREETSIALESVEYFERHPNIFRSQSTLVSDDSHCQVGGAIVLAPTIDLGARCRATDLNQATLFDRVCTTPIPTNDFHFLGIIHCYQPLCFFRTPSGSLF